MRGDRGQDAPRTIANIAEKQAHEKRVADLHRRSVDESKEYRLQYNCDPHRHGPFQPRLDDAAEHELLRNRRASHHGKRLDQPRLCAQAHGFSIFLHPAFRQQGKHQTDQHIEADRAEGAEAHRPARAVTKARRLG